MKHFYELSLFLFFLLLTSCGTESVDNNYIPVEESPVVMDLNAVPYPKLSDYKFFEGEMKRLQPVYGVLPYDLNSQLFTDYAQKKRFVWMPNGTKATYTADNEVLDFPVGTALIKNFYYDAVVTGGEPDMVETRIMIKKANGWIFANYVWNENRTEAVLNDNNNDRRLVEWVRNGQTEQTYYKIPSAIQCALCHTLNDKPTAIGPKPQNLNKSYNYKDGLQNQLSKWIAYAYLDTAPQSINSTIDWTDTTKPLELRVRSYLDINCAHCHTTGAYCSYTHMDFAFNKSNIPANLGLCREPVDFVSGDQQYIVAKQDAEGSLLYFRMNNNIQSEMMPLIGRTVVHEEAVQMIEQWINSMNTPCE